MRSFLCWIQFHRWFYESDRFRRCERCNKMQQLIRRYVGGLGGVPETPFDYWETVRAPDR